MRTLGEALISLLEAHGVDTVFGIPGVHTVELYRGLAGSKIRHVTPRHEQGAGFMADGYARVCGKPGVALVITGPGLTNTITAMGQARADSVPMLVISGVNATGSLGKGHGHLHELPDQRGMMEKVALFSHRVTGADELPRVLARAFAVFTAGRPGPVHLEIPIDVMRHRADHLVPSLANATPPKPVPADIEGAAELLSSASRPLLLAGGGARNAASALQALAEALDAPVVLTTNARGLLHGHPLAVPASPSLAAVRELMADADAVVAVGTEFGQTDYDMYADNGFKTPRKLIRIDIDPGQLARWETAVPILADSAAGLHALLPALLARGIPRAAGSSPAGSARARRTREAALASLPMVMRSQIAVVETIRDALPGSIIVGDSTQPIYAANLHYSHDRPGGWFNAATGFGALGYGPPAAIGAAIAAAGAPVVCLTGDGGFQFSLPELAAAVESNAPVIFVVWNNNGYREIETSMRDAGVEPVGVSPAPPDFGKLAAAYGVAAERLASPDGLPAALARARSAMTPYLIEIMVD